MVPRNIIAAGIQANEKEDQCRDECCRAKEVDTFEGGFGGMFDRNFDGEAYQGPGDDSQWHSKEVTCVSKSVIRYIDFVEKPSDVSEAAGLCKWRIS